MKICSPDLPELGYSSLLLPNGNAIGARATFLCPKSSSSPCDFNTTMTCLMDQEFGPMWNYEGIWKFPKCSRPNSRMCCSNDDCKMAEECIEEQCEAKSCGIDQGTYLKGHIDIGMAPIGSTATLECFDGFVYRKLKQVLKYVDILCKLVDTEPRWTLVDGSDVLSCKEGMFFNFFDVPRRLG